MSKFDSLTHAMTTIATGGFSNYNQSIGYFDSIPIEIAFDGIHSLRKYTIYCIH
jgi:Trk-type K+ transport system membrane component